MDFKKMLNGLVGSQVAVWTGESTSRNEFEPAISVVGTLEVHPDGNDYRVVVNGGCYAYFREANLVEIIENPKGFKDGSKAVIKIKMAKVESVLCG